MMSARGGPGAGSAVAIPSATSSGESGGAICGSAPKSSKRSPFSRNQQDPKEGRDGGGLEGDAETPSNTNPPMSTASLMYHALRSGIGAMGRDGPDKT